MQLHANDIRNIRGDIRDLVLNNNITFILPRAPEPVVVYPEPAIQVVDYIGIVGNNNV